MYNNKTVKELRQILEEHNCAIPNGAKKNDLVELVEAVMAKDEDFVTMQIESPDDMFDELFDDTEQEESKEVVIEESVGEESRPSMFSDEWNEFVMAHFHRNELIDGNPICAGLRRVAEFLLGDIVESGPEQVFPATDGSSPDRAPLKLRERTSRRTQVTVLRIFLGVPTMSISAVAAFTDLVEAVAAFSVGVLAGVTLGFGGGAWALAAATIAISAMSRTRVIAAVA